MLIDLQLHSNFSDGYLSPKEIVMELEKRKIRVASLTDHNTTAGLTEFKKEAKKKNIKAINGLELYVRFKKRRLNILWYNFDEKNEELQKLLESSRKHRLVLVKKSLLALKDRGFKVDIEDILSSFDNYIPVNRLSNKIVSNKYNYNLAGKEIKKKVRKRLLPLREEDILGELFFNEDFPKLNESYIAAERLFEIKKRLGGQLVFCHPGKYNKFSGNITEKLKDLGLDGIEVLSSQHSIGAIMYAQFLSEKLDLIATGGSDFHLFEGGDSLAQSSWDWFRVDSKKLRRIKEIIS
jgi:3',5'-nucleoside bisphosphate phosphatase